MSTHLRRFNSMSLWALMIKSLGLAGVWRTTLYSNRIVTKWFWTLRISFRPTTTVASTSQTSSGASSIATSRKSSWTTNVPTLAPLLQLCSMHLIRPICLIFTSQYPNSKAIWATHWQKTLWPPFRLPTRSQLITPTVLLVERETWATRLPVKGTRLRTDHQKK